MAIGRAATSLSLFLALGLLLRLAFLGNPIQHIDEQFYLLAADRLAQGQVLYVDIWDRKPPGLFLIFRAALALPGDPVLVSQAFGLFCAVATAMVIEAMARRIATPGGARLAGLAYLAFMPVFGCGYAQSPVFYNLPVALAAWLAVDTVSRGGEAALFRRGLGVMALFGLAMQIKYTAAFEGIGLGLLLLAHGRRSVPPARLASYALAWIAMAAAPTLLAWGLFALHGHGGAFAQANFISIFDKTTDDGRDLIRLGQAVLIVSPLLVGVFRGKPEGASPETVLALRCWAIASVGGYLLFGRWYDHYVGPLLTPLTILAAPLLGRLRWYPWLVGFVALATNLVTVIDRLLNDGTAQEAHAAAARIATDLHGGCLYQFQGESALYRLTRACIPTRFAFPDHLSITPEAQALGLDAATEVRRIMMSRPAVVLVDNAPRPYMQNTRNRAIVDSALTADYEERGEIVIGRHHFGYWRLKR